ncbi:acylneuraminate cytidylyltransferase family protein [Clostridium perfringens]|nr:acylneuraminate cytidylyltransferase family protein [Clostridium perfringens]MDU2516347.1 acylneuraminate cytidylyltransferase family protein [Clostridium perfringens]
MKKKKKVVAFVPIKLNSQRLPNKNKLPIGDKPLCYHICNTLLQVKNIDEVYVFCSSEEVLNYVPSGVNLLIRDKYLDGDLVKGAEIYSSFINKVDSDVYILAHTTSPFTRVETVANALDKVIFEEYDSALSVQKIQTFSWYNGKPINYDINDIPRTQDLEPIYIETSAFFIFEKSVFVDKGRRIGDSAYLQVVDHIESIDIDTKEDYDFALKLT